MYLAGAKLFKWTTHKYCIHFMSAHHAPLNNDRRSWVGLLLLVKLVYFILSTIFYANVDSVGLLSAFLAFVMQAVEQSIHKTFY